MKKLHDAILEALKEDDGLDTENKKYGVREYQDWKECADEIEAAMMEKMSRLQLLTGKVGGRNE